MAPLIFRGRFFDVLTLTDEFTANIVLFHLRPAPRALLPTFQTDSRLDNGFSLVIDMFFYYKQYASRIKTNFKRTRFFFFYFNLLNASFILI